MTTQTLLMLLCLFLATSASAASFDCRLARSKAEVLVCSDPELSALDDRLSLLFKRALQASSNKREFRAASDREWTRRETSCSDRACVFDWYLQRQAQLESFLQTRATESKQDGAKKPLQQGPPVANKPSAAKDAERELVNCLAPKAQLGQYSSLDGGRSVRSMLVACPSESLAWVQRCVSQGDTQETCTFKVTAVAQDALRALKR